MTDQEKLVRDRRAFLRGFVYTSAGLLVPRKVISIPKLMPGAAPFRVPDEAWVVEGLGVNMTASFSGSEWRLAT